MQVDVLRVIQEFHPLVSGPANQVRASTQGLQELGWRSTVYTCLLPQAAGPTYELMGRVPVRRFRCRGPFLSSYYAPGIWRAARASRHRVLHVHGFRNLVADGALLIGYRRREPIVLQPHGIAAAYRHILSGAAQWPYRSYDWTLGRMLRRRIDAVVAATEAERTECIQYGFDSDRVVVIPAGIREDHFVDPSTHRRQSIPRLLFVGRISHDRNIAAIIDAIEQLRAAGQHVTMRIVGRSTEMSVFNESDYLGRLKQRVNELGLQEVVTFVGEKTGEDLLAEYANADLFIYPSRYDNFGQAILEAAAAALPILTTPVGVARDLVRPGLTGEFLHPDGSDIAAATTGLLADRSRLQQMGTNARTAAAEYLWPRVVGRYSELYSQLLS